MTENVGHKGEAVAAKYYQQRGWLLLNHNYRTRMGEIDLILYKEGTLVFAEVKLRKNDMHGEAKEFVNYSKQQKIIRTASLFLAGYDTEKQPRFDVIEVYAPQGMFSPVKINHIEDAFM